MKENYSVFQKDEINPVYANLFTAIHESANSSLPQFPEKLEPTAITKTKKKKRVHTSQLSKKLKCAFQANFKTVLAFLGGGEVWSTLPNLSNLLKIEITQTEKILDIMVVEKLLMCEELVTGEWLYGISTKGLKFIDMASCSRPFRLRVTSISSVPHQVLTQKCRFELESAGADDWLPGKSMFKKTHRHLKNIPDAIFHLSGTVAVAMEVELHVKSSLKMKQILNNYYDDMGDIDDPMSPVQVVIYYTPHVKAITKLIDKYIPTNRRSQFWIFHLDKSILPFEETRAIPSALLQRLKQLQNSLHD